ncbi:CynX/NimT family MFS transporter [Aestuariimicrobium ganziense]|uniref:CynX/NimT family MFS transporter n=1 Tax=Aestuariimicrobium ganziense TaxID=2773677 RepID=UPI0019459EBC|nr:MFS transporter [Aestuariimicrobium ganziense]
MSTPHTPSTDHGRPTTHWWQGGTFMLVAIGLLAFNLRPVAIEVGPVLPDLQRDLGLTGLTAGLLTSLPTICFGAFGAVAAGLAGRLGTHRTVTLALVAVLVGSVLRTQTSNSWLFLAASTLALAGMAVGNVLIPSVVRQHFAGHIGLVTAVYSLSLSIGVTLASVVTVPVAQALGGWPPSFLVNASVVVLALLPWLVALRHDRGHTTENRPRAISLARVARTRLGWMMAIFFGFQSAQAYSVFGWLPSIYQDAGLSAERAGLMLGIATGLGIPLAFLWPAWMMRRPRPVGLLLVVTAAAWVGYTGLLVAPGRWPWLWAAVIALGTSAFPMILAMFGMRARTSEGTAALSGFAQSVGYAIALAGPFLMGALHEATGGWTWSIVLLLSMTVPMVVSGVVSARAGWIEDELH